LAPAAWRGFLGRRKAARFRKRLAQRRLFEFKKNGGAPVDEQVCAQRCTAPYCDGRRPIESIDAPAPKHNQFREGLARRDREWSLNDGQIPHFCIARVHVTTGYNRVEGDRRASRNGAPLPPEESLAFRLVAFCDGCSGGLRGGLHDGGDAAQGGGGEARRGGGRERGRAAGGGAGTARAGVAAARALVKPKRNILAFFCDDSG
jgi:hypothetical protein